MSSASRLAVCCLVAVSAHAQSGLLQGVTIRLHGGLDHMAGLDDVNDQIASMNHYFGIDGTWVEDAQGANVGNWAPYLKVPKLNNRPDMGVSIEKDVLVREAGRLSAGLEFSAGGTEVSNLFAFSPGTGLTASIFARENVSVTNLLATCRYSIKDNNLPLYASAGLGLGFGSITAEGAYVQRQVSAFEADPMFGETVIQHQVEADYDGSALTARLFVGAEYELGPMSVQLDMGYNYMNFGELDGKTVERFRDNEGNFEAWQVEGAPDTRYEFVPLISESLQRAVDNARLAALGLPVDETPIDLEGDAKSIEYDLSGGYVRLGLGYRF